MSLAVGLVSSFGVGAVERLLGELSAVLQGQRHRAGLDRRRAGHASGESGHGRHAGGRRERGRRGRRAGHGRRPRPRHGAQRHGSGRTAGHEEPVRRGREGAVGRERRHPHAGAAAPTRGEAGSRWRAGFSFCLIANVFLSPVSSTVFSTQKSKWPQSYPNKRQPQCAALLQFKLGEISVSLWKSRPLHFPCRLATSFSSFCSHANH